MQQFDTRFTPDHDGRHTGCMELYTLRLGAPLSWTPIQPPALDSNLDIPSSGFDLPVLDQDGSEAIFLWTRDQLVVDSNDGPHIKRPVPPPLRSGSSGIPSDPALEPPTVATVDAASDTLPDSTLQSGRLVLSAGSYLFCQGRPGDLESIAQTLEWFFREGWWIRAEVRGPVYLRLIREDGKTAVQVIMESAKEG